MKDVVISRGVGILDQPTGGLGRWEKLDWVWGGQVLFLFLRYI